MEKIVQKNDPVLRKIAEPVELDKIASPEIKKVIDRMKIALASQDDGVAIAAPQIGVSLRIFVVSGKIFEMLHPEREIPENELPHDDLVFINPEIIKISKDKRAVEEGCLSVRYLYGKIRRASKATVTAYNEKGEKITRGGSGLLAQIFQHEIDHLNGILFIDSAKEIRDLPPTKKKVKVTSNE